MRGILLRAGRSYPDASRSLIDRAIGNRQMRDSLYEQVMGFAAVLCETMPEQLVALTKAALFERLPLEQLRWEREQDRRSSSPFLTQGSRPPGYDDVGIEQHHRYYFPPSPLHEPFASLFAHSPDHALALIRDLGNRAITGWRQVHRISPQQYGTPLPVDLSFPWGRQRFWGDQNTYRWSEGAFAPQPLECAFLALAHWAHRQIDEGRDVDDTIRVVVEGQASWGVVAIAASLALEKWHASETVLPIASCQRALHDDLARLVGESSRGVDLFGVGAFTKLYGPKAEADTYLKQRPSRWRELRQLAPYFALSPDRSLRDRYRKALQQFPRKLQPHLRELRDNAAHMERLRESAENWAGLGDAANYRTSATEDGKHTVISFEQPVVPSKEQTERLEESQVSMREMTVRGWAMKSQQEGKLAEGMTLADAFTFARQRNRSGLFAQLGDVHLGSQQDTVAAVAAVIIRFGRDQKQQRWAWNVMAHIERMADSHENYAHASANIPWHATFQLNIALLADRRATSPRPDSVERLLRLCLHPNEIVARGALAGLSNDPEIDVSWMAAGLASDLFIQHWPVRNPDDYRLDWSEDRAYRARMVEQRIRRTAHGAALPLTPPPAPFVSAGDTGVGRPRGQGIADPLIAFDPREAEELARAFPIERWMESAAHRPLMIAYLRQLAEWTAARMHPPGNDREGRRSVMQDMHLWPARLGELMGRICPFLPAEQLIAEFLSLFADADDENGLTVLTAFASSASCRHVLDAKTILPEAIAALQFCADRLAQDRTFHRGMYRAGEVHGAQLPDLIRSLLFVGVEEAPGAARFANGAWGDLPAVMLLIASVVMRLGWSSFVMDRYLRLCERADRAFPVDDFCDQVLYVLEGLGRDALGWSGSDLAARISSLVQRYADRHFPLNEQRARKLLTILDHLIDLGDRRSAALEQMSAFRSLQNLAP